MEPSVAPTTEAIASLLFQDQLVAFGFILSMFVGPVILVWLVSRIRISVPSLPVREPRAAKPARVRTRLPPITSLLTGGSAMLMEHPVFGAVLFLVTLVGVMFQPLGLPWWVGAILFAPMVVFLAADARRNVNNGAT